VNLILVILDSLRRDHVGCYGNDWIKTPALDALATESIRLTNAYPESLPTIQARQSIYTGNRLFPFRDHQSRKGDFVRWPGWQPVRETEITMAEIMAHAGYRSGLVTDVYHQFKPSMNFHRGFQQFAFVRGQEGDAYASSARTEGVDISKRPASESGRDDAGEGAPSLPGQRLRAALRGGLVRAAGLPRGDAFRRRQPAGRFLSGGRLLRPARAVGSASVVLGALRSRLQRPGPHLPPPTAPPTLSPGPRSTTSGRYTPAR
jgi:hypothetical protein